MTHKITVEQVGPVEIGIMSSMVDGPRGITSYTVMCVKEAEELAEKLLSLCQDIRREASDIKTTSRILTEEPNTGVKLG